MRQIVTSVEKNQRAIIFLESLEGNPKAEQAASGVTATDLNTDQGINLLFENVFQSETVGEAYSTYPAFTSFKRTVQMNNYRLYSRT